MFEFFTIQLDDGEFIRVISRAYAKQCVLEQGLTEDDFCTYPSAAVRDECGYTFYLKGHPGAKAMVDNTGSVLLRL